MTTNVAKVIKCCVIGDHVGKTCFLIRYLHKKFPDDYIPRDCDTETRHGVLDGVSYTLGLFDCSMQGEDFDRLRPLSYRDTDVFLVCMSVASPDRLQRIRDYWVPEIKHHCPGVPFLLVGTQIDLREDEETNFKISSRGLKMVSVKKGAKVARGVGAEKYLECSAFKNEGVEQVIEALVRTALADPQQKKKRRCVLL